MSVIWGGIGIAFLNVYLYIPFYMITVTLISLSFLLDRECKKGLWSWATWVFLLITGCIFYLFPWRGPLTDKYLLSVIMPFFIPYYLWLISPASQGIYPLFLITYALIAVIMIPLTIFTQLIPSSCESTLFTLPGTLVCLYMLTTILLYLFSKKKSSSPQK